MAFNVDEARKAGYNPQDIAQYLADSRGESYQDLSSGNTDEQIIKHFSGKESLQAEAEPVDETPGVITSVAKGTGAFVTGTAKSVGVGLKYLGQKLGNKNLWQVGQEAAEYWGEVAEEYAPEGREAGSILEDPSLLADASWWAYNLPQVAGSMITSIVPGVGASKFINLAGKTMRLTPSFFERSIKAGVTLDKFAKGVGTGVMAGTAGAQQAASLYQESLDLGATPGQAAGIAEGAFLASTVLNGISFNKMFKASKIPSNLREQAKRAGGIGVTEAGTEYTEEALGIAELYIADLIDEAEFGQRLMDAANVAPLAFVTGAAVGGVTGRPRGEEVAPVVEEEVAPEIAPTEEVAPVEEVTPPVAEAVEEEVTPITEPVTPEPAPVAPTVEPPVKPIPAVAPQEPGRAPTPEELDIQAKEEEKAYLAEQRALNEAEKARLEGEVVPSPAVSKVEEDVVPQKIADVAVGEEKVLDTPRGGSVRVSQVSDQKYTMEFSEAMTPYLDRVRSEVETGVAGKRISLPAEEGLGSTVEWTGIPSTFPDYFKNKGYTKKETLTAIDKATQGEELGVRQVRIVNDLLEGVRRSDAEQYLSMRSRRPVPVKKAAPPRQEEIMGPGNVPFDTMSDALRYKEGGSYFGMEMESLDEYDVAPREEGGFTLKLNEERAKELNKEGEVTLEEDKESSVTLSFMGTGQMIDELKKMIDAFQRPDPENITVYREPKKIHVGQTLLSPSKINSAKLPYYVRAGKTAMRKLQEGRSETTNKLNSIFAPLNKEGRREITVLGYRGDLDGKDYNKTELMEMGVSKKVIDTYLQWRKLHRAYWQKLYDYRKMKSGHGEDDATLLPSEKGKLGYLKGHVPHFFERWNVLEVNPGQVDNEHVGNFASVKDASKFLEGSDPDKKYIIKPQAFIMPEGALHQTVLKDTSHSALMRKVEEEFTLSREEASEFVQGIAKKQNRDKFFGNILERKNQKFWKQGDLYETLDRYYNSVERYTALDTFKNQVTGRFQKDFGVKLGEADDTTSNYVQTYINNILGVPSMVEQYVDSALKNLLGDRIKTSRPLTSATNTILQATAYAKLGLFNLSSGFVNMTQTANTFAITPFEYFQEGIKKGLRPIKTITAKDKEILKDLGVAHDIGLAEAGVYNFKGKALSLLDKTMIIFNTAEQLNRRVVGLAAYNWGVKGKGMDKGQALNFAREQIDRTQFDYSVADTPAVLRLNPLTRTAGQFKPFVIKQIEFLTGLKGAENIKFWIPMLIVGGINEIPFSSSLSDIIEWLTGYNPITAMKEELMSWAGDDPTKRAAADTMMYGVGSSFGVDISRRVGTGDALPASGKDLLGPAISTILQLKTTIEKDAGLPAMAKSIAPGLGNILEGLKIVQNDMTATDPWHRHRKKYKAGVKDVLLKSVGFRPIKESHLSDMEKIRNKNTVAYSRIHNEAIDRFIAAGEDSEAASDAINWAIEQGEKEVGVPVIITGKAIRQEYLQKARTQAERNLRRTKKALRPKMQKVIDYIEAEMEEE